MPKGGLEISRAIRDWWMQMHKLQGQWSDAQAGNSYNLYYLEFVERKIQKLPTIASAVLAGIGVFVEWNSFKTFPLFACFCFPILCIPFLFLLFYHVISGTCQIILKKTPLQFIFSHRKRGLLLIETWPKH